MSNQFTKLNRIVSLIILAIGLVIYGSTVAPTLSYWDCGEFIASALVFGSPHPPGAPLFMVVGRIAAMFGGSAQEVALYVNWLSVLSSVFTLYFMYLSIMILFEDWRGKINSMSEFVGRSSSAAIGTLCFAFSHSFWFNAVETEMYAHHMLFLSAILYLMLRWMQRADEKGSERYFLLIAYLIGLSIGVHLLTVLIIPVLAMLYYHKKASKKSNLGLFLSFVVGGVILMIVYPGIVKIYPALVVALGDIVWGAVIFFALVAVAYYVMKENKNRWLQIALNSLVLIILGFTTYAVVYIRSGLDPKLDMNNPENLENILSLINRDQYGEMYTFPRRWNVKNPRTEKIWVGDGSPILHDFGEGNVRQITSQDQIDYRTNKTSHLGAQLEYLWTYQINHLLFRYIGWNFVGTPDREPQDSDSVPSKYWWVLILSLIGAVYQWSKDPDKFWSIFTIWFMFGLAIIIYTNPNEPQPRERDYTFVACFYAMAIWIAYGAFGIIDSLKKVANSPAITYAVALLLITLLPGRMLQQNYHMHDRSSNYVAWDMAYNILQSCEPNAVLFNNGDNDTYPIWFLQLVEGIRTDVTAVNLSLVNTPWYIKQQMSGQLGTPAPIEWPEDRIDKINIIPWKKRNIEISVPTEISKRQFDALNESKQLPVSATDSGNTKIDFELGPQYYAPTAQGQVGVLRVQDQMVLHMIMANKWKRPINFAATIASSNLLDGLKDYFKLDGMVYKLTSEKGWGTDPEVLEKLLFEKYQFRGLSDESLYLDQMTISLIQNYRNSFLQLAEHYRKIGEKEKQKAVLTKMNEMINQKTVPISNDQLRLQIEILTTLDETKDLTVEKLQEMYTEQELQLIWYMAHSQLQNYELRNLAINAQIGVLPKSSKERQQIMRYRIELNRTDKGLVAEYISGYESEYPDQKELIDQLKKRYQ